MTNDDEKPGKPLPPKIEVVNIPLTAEEVAWLREQKKKVYDTYQAYKRQRDK